VSTDPDEDFTASLEHLTVRTSAAAGALRQRVTLADAVTPTPAKARVAPAPQTTHKISLRGSRHGPPSALAAPALRWVQEDRDAILQASQRLAGRVPGALAAMASVAAGQGSRTAITPRPRAPVVPARKRGSTQITVRAPVARPERVTPVAFVAYACSITSWVTTALGVAPSIVSTVGLGATVSFGLLWLTWLHRTWRSLLAADLVDGSGKPVTPDAAVGRYFIPLYNLYWAFAAQTILCNALGAATTRASLTGKPPRTLGTFWVAVGLIPYVNIVAAPLFGLVFMAKVDDLMRGVRKAGTP
jgi:hypothetical protein